MDISKLSVDGEWLKLETDNEDFGNLEVLVVPRKYGGLMKMVMNDDMIQLISTLVIGWNLTIGKKEIECTHENKMKYLSIMADWKIKNPRYAQKGAMFETIGAEIIAFAQDIKNFTKNSKPISN